MNPYNEQDSLIQLQLVERKAKDKELKKYSIKPIRSVLWRVPIICCTDVVRADLLHNVYLGILKHLMTWIKAFLQEHK